MKFWRWVRRCFSKYGMIPLILAFAYNCAVYWVCGVLSGGRTIPCVLTPVDRAVPLLDWTVWIYLGCYVFWIVNYVMIYRESREKAYRFFISDFISRTVCMIFFLAMPWTLERPEVTGTGLSSDLLRFVYRIDRPVNLFPSIHCLVSWNCYIGIRGSRQVPVWYQRLSILFAVAVFVSTLTTKQHVLIDVIGGAALSELSWFAAKKTGWWHYVERGFDKAAEWIFPGGDSSGEGVSDGEKGNSLYRRI